MYALQFRGHYLLWSRHRIVAMMWAKRVARTNRFRVAVVDHLTGKPVFTA